MQTHSFVGTGQDSRNLLRNCLRSDLLRSFTAGSPDAYRVVTTRVGKGLPSCTASRASTTALKRVARAYPRHRRGRGTQVQPRRECPSDSARRSRLRDLVSTPQRRREHQPAPRGHAVAPARSFRRTPPPAAEPHHVRARRQRHLDARTPAVATTTAGRLSPFSRRWLRAARSRAARRRHQPRYLSDRAAVDLPSHLYAWDRALTSTDSGVFFRESRRSRPSPLWGWRETLPGLVGRLGSWRLGTFPSIGGTWTVRRCPVMSTSSAVAGCRVPGCRASALMGGARRTVD